ncbi:MAG: response regulator [Chitinophagales bacterium]
MLLITQRQEIFQPVIVALIGNGHSVLIVDNWTAEMAEPLDLETINLIFVDSDLFIPSGLNIALELKHRAAKADVILVANKPPKEYPGQLDRVISITRLKEEYPEILAEFTNSLQHRGTPPIDAGSKHILIIDDDEFALEILSNILERKGFNVEEAPTAYVGLALVRKALMEQSPFDLIIVDLMMPEMDGFEFMNQLRSGKWGTNTPVLVSSSRNDYKTISDVHKMNISGYVLKPFDPDLLIERVIEAIRKGPISYHVIKTDN